MNQTYSLWSSGINTALSHSWCAANPTLVSASRTAVRKTPQINPALPAAAVASAPDNETRRAQVSGVGILTCLGWNLKALPLLSADWTRARGITHRASNYSSATRDRENARTSHSLKQGAGCLGQAVTHRKVTKPPLLGTTESPNWCLKAMCMGIIVLLPRLHWTQSALWKPGIWSSLTNVQQ